MSTLSSSNVSSAVTGNMNETSITSPRLNRIHSAPDFSNLSNMPEFWRDQSDFESSCFRLVARALTDRIADKLVSRIGTMSSDQEKQMKEMSVEPSHVSLLKNIGHRTDVNTTMETMEHETLMAQNLHSRLSRVSIMQSLLRRNHTELTVDNNNKSVKFQENQAKLEVKEPVKSSLKRVQTSPATLDTFDDFSRLAVIYGGN